jgi:hypothetical protein
MLILLHEILTETLSMLCFMPVLGGQYPSAGRRSRFAASVVYLKFD